MSQLDVDKLLQAFKTGFKANRTIDIADAGYHIHMDRQLPFLVIYRNTKQDDRAIVNIVNTFSSFVILPDYEKLGEQNKRLIEALVAIVQKTFKGCLLIEIWTKPLASTHVDGKPRCQLFHLYASPDNPSNITLDTLENALQTMKMRKRRAEVQVHFQAPVAPPGLPAIFDSRDTEPAISLIGLEILETYRNPETNEVYPYAVKKLKQQLEKAIKKTAYEFSLENTLYRPAHYHVLGPQSLTDPVWDCDKRLADIDENFDLLLHVTPVNAPQAWEFFKKKHFDKKPVFHYRPRTMDPTLLKRALYRIPIETIDDPALGDLFTLKRDELDEQISLLHKRDTPQFLYGSIQLFGTIDDSLLKTAKNLLNTLQRSVKTTETAAYNAREFSRKADETLEHYRGQDPAFKGRVEVRDDITGILVSHGNFLIGNDAKVPESRLNAALSHEVETHVLTYHNGRQQAFCQLYAGLAGYEELQEGLAVLSEYLVGGLTPDRLLTLAARVVAVDSIIKGADFIETFRLLNKEYGLSSYSAYYTTMRVYRGGGYTKDMIYLRGLIRLLDLVQDLKTPELLFVGKISFDAFHLIEELYWRNIIKKPALLPRYLDSDTAQHKLQKLKSSAGLDTILEEL